MNDFIGGEYNNQTQEQIRTKKMMKIIGIILAILLIIAICLIALMYYIQTTELKIFVDGNKNTKLEKVLIFEGEKVYVPIRAFAQYAGYESYSADYENKYTEDATKCYVQSTNEIASFSLDSNKIYKILTSNNSDYEYFEIDEPVKMINDQLCTTVQGAKIAFNISMSYDKNKNEVKIYTLPYLVKNYNSKYSNSALSENSASFNNQKALLYNRLIVKNKNNNYGVQDLNGQEILGTKYSSITFLESTKEFVVTTLENKMGIMSYNAETKISPQYDNIKQIDKDSGLYLVTNNQKQGVVNSTGNTVIYLEYDQIGVNSSQYASNKIKNQYLLYDKCIPAKKNGMWELYDKTGKKITNETYSDLGCVKSGQENANDILLVPQYEGIIIKKNDLYGLIDSQGNALLPIALQSIYSTTSAGEDTYYMIYNGKRMNVIDYIKKYVRPD